MGRPIPPELIPSHQVEQDVILGMPGPWADDNCESCDHYTTKIGGLPGWPIPTEEVESGLLKCGSCGGDLTLVAQVYAPVVIRGVGIDDRTLYVFGCPSLACGISPLSWRTLRIQKQGGPPSSVTIDGSGSSYEASSSSTGETAREEGLPGREEEQWWEDDSWEPANNHHGIVDQGGTVLAMQELESALLEAGYAAATRLAEQNGNTSEETATAQDNGSVIGGDQAQLALPVLPCFNVNLQSECHPPRGNRALGAMQNSELQEGRQDRNGAEESWEGEEYEYDRALSADRTYLKFKKRLDFYPEQCFRYFFGGQPLWANKEDKGEVGVCGVCGGPRIYEMQLMPPLLYYEQQACKELPSTSYSTDAWEWLTLLVFSCAQSCTPARLVSAEDGGERSQWHIIEEATILQHEI